MLLVEKQIQTYLLFGKTNKKTASFLFTNKKELASYFYLYKKLFRDVKRVVIASIFLMIL